VTIAGQKALRVARVLFKGTVRPQRVPEAHPFVSVFGPCGSDGDQSPRSACAFRAAEKASISA
jgi:hypothetical protein